MFPGSGLLWSAVLSPLMYTVDHLTNCLNRRSDCSSICLFSATWIHFQGSGVRINWKCNCLTSLPGKKIWISLFNAQWCPLTLSWSVTPKALYWILNVFGNTDTVTSVPFEVSVQITSCLFPPFGFGKSRAFLCLSCSHSNWTEQHLNPKFGVLTLCVRCVVFVSSSFPLTRKKAWWQMALIYFFWRGTLLPAWCVLNELIWLLKP